MVIPELPPAMDVAPGLSRVGALALLSRSTVVLLPARAYLLAPTMNEFRSVAAEGTFRRR